MGIEFWTMVVFTLSLGAGLLLLVQTLPRLSQRAKTLGMWPHRQDEHGPIPYRIIWPEWSLALFMDLFRRSEQRDSEYLGHQRRARWGAVLVVVGFAGVALFVKLSEN
jgi:hypothetical protein